MVKMLKTAIKNKYKIFILTKSKTNKMWIFYKNK